MAPTVEGIASDGTNAMGQDAVDLREKLNAEERQLAERRTSTRNKQIWQHAEKNWSERASKRAIDQARMQNEAAQIALLEQETQALTQSVCSCRLEKF